MAALEQESDSLSSFSDAGGHCRRAGHPAPDAGHAYSDLLARPGITSCKPNVSRPDDRIRYVGIAGRSDRSAESQYNSRASKVFAIATTHGLPAAQAFRLKSGEICLGTQHASPSRHTSEANGNKQVPIGKTGGIVGRLSNARKRSIYRESLHFPVLNKLPEYP